MAFKLGICTLSLGQASAGHTLSDKLRAARAHGIQGVEIFDEDLYHLADSFPGGRTQECNRMAAAVVIRHLCATEGLEIICLQPFRHYEGILDRARHAERFAELQHYMTLAHLLGTNLILIPSSFLPSSELSASDDDAVADLVKAADYAAQLQPPSG
ncbi:unnamed protein product [Parascedosporium putredinis]|uniref:Xylose isomerase-like TIM barrel domain-containing protein n=1 Tax=Parascedosporium putredinis TaxID=1442378 RepID=A0A9P1GY42_9PEZI|nr:unnamed protein product [Parascedosporium putredinis]CAI7989608.1 unnamed protein product [Parascedosporium putredinis]